MTHRLVLALAVPMTLAYLSTPLLGIVDTAVIGQLSDAALIGGLAVGALLVSTVATSLNFLRSGTTGLTAQALGAGDEAERDAILVRAVSLAAIIGIVFLVLSPLILELGLWLMEPGASVATATGTYFKIRMLSMPLALVNYALLGWFIGLGRAGLALGLQLLLNGTNIVLSIVLGLWLELGIEGVATATVIAEFFAALCGIWLATRIVSLEKLPRIASVMTKASLLRLMSLNTDIMIRSFALIFAFGFFTAQGAKFGAATLAANAILMHFFYLAGYFLDGLATAAEQLAGRTVGAKQATAFRRSVWLTTLWGVVLACALSVLFLVGGELAIHAITNEPAVREIAREYLIWAALIPVTAILAFELDGVYIGATWSRDMSMMMLVSLAAYVLIFYAVREPYANTGLWFALHCFVGLRALTLAARMPVNFRREFVS